MASEGNNLKPRSHESSKQKNRGSSWPGAAVTADRQAAKMMEYFQMSGGNAAIVLILQQPLEKNVYG